MNVTPDISAWVRHLDAIADAMIADRPASDAEGAIAPAFADAVDPPATPADAADRTGGPLRAADLSGDIRLWRALRLPPDAASTVVDEILRAAPAPTCGPMFDQGLFTALEVWTAAELAALHALWRLTREHDRADWRTRVAAHRDWFLDELQPDNATNRPWAIHVFLLADAPEAAFYGETLLHNAQTVGDDLLSGWILRDAARELARAAGSSPTA